MRRRFLCLGVGAVLCGCAGGAVTPLPGIAPEAVARAAAEIGDLPPPPRRQLADGEVTRTLDRIARRLNPPAEALCRDLGVASCDWHVKGSRSRRLNASAAADGRITINRGVIEYARTEEETAFVVGHELAHQIANHPRSSGADAEAGATVGALLGAALVVVSAAAGSRAGPSQNRRSIEGMAGTGSRLGVLAFSKDQEREADRLALLLLWRAGYRPEAARGVLITMSRATARRETGLFDSHPAGPERLAAFDATLAELRASGGTIPLRAG